MSPHKKYRRLGFALLFLLFNLAVFKFSELDAAAYSASITTSGTINLDVSAAGNGTNVAKDEVTINSTCPLGYTLSVSGPADSALYKDGDKTSTSKINASAGTKNNPVSLIDNKNTWGYATGSNITASSNFIGLTNTSVELTAKTSASITGGDKFSVFYGASVDATTPAGQYKLAESSTGANDNHITYFLTPNPACGTYYIRYNENGANSSSKMGNQTVTNTNADLTFWASNFKNPTNKGFAGWNTKSDGTGTKYGPNETIPAANVQSFLETNAKVENGALYVDLYAMWIQSAGDLQNWNGCASMNVGDVTALKDARDNNTYAVAKLADGKCWMIENFRLDNTATLTIANTNNPLNNGTDVTLKNTDGATANHLSVSTNPATTAWCIDTNEACPDQSMLYTGNTTNPATNISQATGQNIYSYGNYYNWYSATAGRGTYSKSSGNTEGDICPIGWHLPTGRTGGEFSSLDTAIGGTGAYQNTTEASQRWRKFPNNFVYSGFIYGSGPNLVTEGYYWSSSATSDSAFGLFVGTGVDPGVYGYGLRRKVYGTMVRCVASESYTIEFNSNGGSGTMANQTIKTGVATNLAANSFTAPTNLVFKGWNTAADGNGTSYTDGQSVTNLAATGQTITLYAVWGCIANTICYNDNGANSPTTMGRQSVDATATEVTLWASNFQRPGYGFAGWSLYQIAPENAVDELCTQATTATGETCVRVDLMHGPNESISTGLGQNGGLTGSIGLPAGLALWAIWVPVANDNNGNELTFQTANLLNATLEDGTTLSSKPKGYVTALKDARDGQVYAVAKLEDGNYWMIENLRLDNTNSDNSTGALAQGYAKSTTYGDFSGLAEPETANFNGATTTANSLYYSGTQSGTASINIGTSGPGYRFPRFNNQNTANPTTNMDGTSDNTYSYGNWYSWPAAVADTGYYNSGSVTTTSICSKGWHLPTGTSSGEYYTLNTALGGGTGPNSSKALRGFPNNFIYSGYFVESWAGNRGSGGYYWSSSVSGASLSYNLSLSSGTTYPGTENVIKNIGYSVRCVIGS